MVQAHRARKVAGKPPEYPSLATQAGNLAGAVGRVVKAGVRGEPVKVTDEVHAARLSICQSCEFYDATRKRCTKCGCGGASFALATEALPADPPRWDAVT